LFDAPLPMPESSESELLEISRPDHPRGPFRCVVFDFDGTLSLLRADWQGLMVPLMVELLAATGTRETAEELTSLVADLVTRTTGRPTIVQMQALADEVRRRGQTPRDPLDYLALYHELLMAQTGGRIEAVQAGVATAEQMMVPGSLPLVAELERRGMLLVISSGTELAHVRYETGVLGLAAEFGARIYGPVDNDPQFSKLEVLERLIRERGLRGTEIVCIGDGPAEMQAARAVGALALGVASDEVSRSGRTNPLKRDHLLRAGADLIVPDYNELPPILRLLTPDS
jgi:phosphoglycolate phosphatase-like HAD superfamily hydrolase